MFKKPDSGFMEVIRSVNIGKKSCTYVLAFLQYRYFSRKIYSKKMDGYDLALRDNQIILYPPFPWICNKLALKFLDKKNLQTCARTEQSSCFVTKKAFRTLYLSGIFSRLLSFSFCKHIF